jgi:hypothetical protein
MLVRVTTLVCMARLRLGIRSYDSIDTGSTVVLAVSVVLAVQVVRAYERGCSMRIRH